MMLGVSEQCRNNAGLFNIILHNSEIVGGICSDKDEDARREVGFDAP
jgi:hypothetical protein